MRRRAPGDGRREQRRVGLIGGTSWQSTLVYYRLLNEAVAARLGGHASAAVTIHSLDFAEVESLQRAGDWPAQGVLLARAAQALERGGAEAVAIAANTLHLVADDVRAAIDVALIDIVDVTAAATREFTTIGLLATGYTMRSELFPSRLAAQGTKVLVPEGADHDTVHRVIYDELVRGIVSDASRDAYRGVITALVARGAEAIVLACTEIGLLIGADDAPVPVLDTAVLHCAALVDVMLGTGENDDGHDRDDAAPGTVRS